jgi:hypothetical protein
MIPPMFPDADADISLPQYHQNTVIVLVFRNGAVKSAGGFFEAV